MNTDGEDKQSTVMSATRRALDGDVNAYEVIYEACDGSLRSFIGRRFGHLGSDFIDEVAIRTHEYVLTRLDKYKSDEGTSFQTWFNWQSRSVAWQVMAERFGPRLVRYDETKHEAWAGSVAGPTEVYEDKRRSRVLREEQEALSEDGRLSVTLHDKDGLTFDETAKATGLPVIRVRRKREQALAVMKRRLQERGIRPVEVDSTPVPIFYGWDHTEPDDDFTESVTAVLPDGPDTLVGAAARDEEKEEPDN